jgi:hypothetical protein
MMTLGLSNKEKCSKVINILCDLVGYLKPKEYYTFPDKESILANLQFHPSTKKLSLDLLEATATLFANRKQNMDVELFYVSISQVFADYQKVKLSPEKKEKICDKLYKVLSSVKNGPQNTPEIAKRLSEIKGKGQVYQFPTKESLKNMYLKNEKTKNVRPVLINAIAENLHLKEKTGAQIGAAVNDALKGLLTSDELQDATLIFRLNSVLEDWVTNKESTNKLALRNSFEN